MSLFSFSTPGAVPPPAGTPSLQRSLGVSPVPQPQPHTLFASPSPQKPQTQTQTPQAPQTPQTEPQKGKEEEEEKRKAAPALVSSFGGLAAIDPMTPLARPARRPTPELGDPDDLQAGLRASTAALVPRTPHRSPPARLHSRRPQPATPATPEPALSPPKPEPPKPKPKPKPQKTAKEPEQKDKEEKKDEKKEEKKEEEPKRWGRRDMALMNMLLECSRCVKDAAGEAVCWVLDPERLCARLADAPATTVAPATARILPTVRCLLRAARPDQSPTALVRAALHAFVAATFDAWCDAQAGAAAAADAEEEAVLWHVLAGHADAAGAAAVRAGRPELAMALVQAETRATQRALAAQAARWRASGPATHPALVAALALLVRDGPDAHLRALLRARLSASSAPPPRVAAAVALAEWERGTRGEWDDTNGDNDVGALLARARALLSEELAREEGEEGEDGDALLPFELVLECARGAGGAAGAWRAFETLCRRVGLLAGWALVQCVEAACPRVPARAGLVHRAAEALAASAAAHGAWTAALFVFLGTDGRAGADGLPCALDEARARATYAAHAPHATRLEARVCREVLCVPCARWALLARAEAAEGAENEGGAHDDWAAAPLYVRARAFAAAARCLHRGALRRVYRAADGRALADAWAAVRVHRAALGAAWSARLEAVCAYARLRTGADPEDAAHVHALCAAVTAAVREDGNGYGEGGDAAAWHGIAHVAEYAARRLEHWALLWACADECAAARTALDALPLAPDLRDSIAESLEAAARA